MVETAAKEKLTLTKNKNKKHSDRLRHFTQCVPSPALDHLRTNQKAPLPRRKTNDRKGGEGGNRGGGGGGGDGGGPETERETDRETDSQTDKGKYRH